MEDKCVQSDKEIMRHSLIVKLTNFLDEEGSFGTCCMCNTFFNDIRCKFMLRQFQHFSTHASN